MNLYNVDQKQDENSIKRKIHAVKWMDLNGITFEIADSFILTDARDLSLWHMKKINTWGLYTKNLLGFSKLVYDWYYYTTRYSIDDILINSFDKVVWLKNFFTAIVWNYDFCGRHSLKP